MSIELVLEPADNQRLASLCGPMEQHLQLIEQYLGVNIHRRGHGFQIGGIAATTASQVIETLYQQTKPGENLPAEEVHLVLRTVLAASEQHPQHNSIQIKHTKIKARGTNQQAYVERILNHTVNFAIGPAGTGKTYLAVACAVAALEKQQVQRILLVRPAVEAGERLGFLPGDLSQKVDPYLRPLYDALYEMMGVEQVTKLIERRVIEIAPLAYMRGRTLSEAFIILDESQNTTREQMKMFLTRIGFGSTAVITGDTTQIDLPKGIPSGLKHAMQVLEHVAGISFTHFSSKDVVRHPLVQKIVEAYDEYEQATAP